KMGGLPFQIDRNLPPSIPAHRVFPLTSDRVANIPERKTARTFQIDGKAPINIPGARSEATFHYLEYPHQDSR
ncbi:hypothetical protein, partial [Aeromonas veronii]|uniref:hypothetical protein n=1 Tax=Aeromonas veronii TaxID=654 RepID=UPI00195A5E48